MYAPVVLRFRTYGAQLRGACGVTTWRHALDDAHLREWLAAAARGDLDHRSIGNRTAGSEQQRENIMKSWLGIAALVVCGLGVHGVAHAADSLARHSRPPISTCWRASAIRRSRPTAATWSTCSAKPISRPIAAAPTCGCSTSTATPPKPRRLTQHSANDTHPRWSVDGTSIYFLSTRAGSTQIWRLPMSGGEAVQITDYPLDVGSFKFSSGGGRIALGMDVFQDCADLKCTRDRLDAATTSKVSARTYDSLFIRHWDTWRDHTRSNLFVAPVNADGRAGTPVNVSRALDADVPSKPDGGDEEFTFTPDGSRVVFSARVAGRAEPWSTNFDLYEAPSDGSATAEESHRRQSGLGHPAGVPEERRPRLAGHEAARASKPIASPSSCVTAAPCARSPRSGIAPSRISTWRSDGSTLLATASDLGQAPLFAIDPSSGTVTQSVRRRAPWREFSPGPRGNGGRLARSRHATRSLSTSAEAASARG